MVCHAPGSMIGVLLLIIPFCTVSGRSPEIFTYEYKPSGLHHSVHRKVSTHPVERASTSRASRRRVHGHDASRPHGRPHGRPLRRRLQKQSPVDATWRVPVSTLANRTSAFRGFDGLAFRENLMFNTGGHPPDGAIARSDKYIVEAINSLVAVFTPSGQRLATFNLLSTLPKSFNFSASSADGSSIVRRKLDGAEDKEEEEQLQGDDEEEVGKEEEDEEREEREAATDGRAAGVDLSIGDPRLVYDAAYDRFMAIYMVVSDTQLDISHNTIFVSNTNDPTKAWTAITTNSNGVLPNGTYYSIKYRGRKHRCPCFADLPSVGIDDHSVILNSNMYATDNYIAGTFTWLYPKDALFKRQRSGWKYSVVVDLLWPEEDGQLPFFSVQPAYVQPGSLPYPHPLGATFLVTTGPPVYSEWQGQDAMWVMAITGTKYVGTHPERIQLSNWCKVELSRPFLPQPAYDATNALGYGGLHLDNRLAAAVSFAGGLLVATFGFRAVWGVDSMNDGVQVMMMRPKLTTNGKLLRVQRVANPYVLLPGYDLYVPTVAADPHGNALAGFQLWRTVQGEGEDGGVSLFGAGFVGLNTKGFTTPVYVAREPKMMNYDGVAAGTNLTGYHRVGDYADAKYHPATKSVTFMGQYAGDRVWNLTYDSVFYHADGVPRPVNVLDNTQTYIGVVSLPKLLGARYCACGCK